MYCRPAYEGNHNIETMCLEKRIIRCKIAVWIIILYLDKKDDLESKYNVNPYMKFDIFICKNRAKNWVKY